MLYCFICLYIFSKATRDINIRVQVVHKLIALQQVIQAINLVHWHFVEAHKNRSSYGLHVRIHLSSEKN